LNALLIPESKIRIQFSSCICKEEESVLLKSTAIFLSGYRKQLNLFIVWVAIGG